MARYRQVCVCVLIVGLLWGEEPLGAKVVYIGNHLVYSLSMAILALVRTKWAIFVFSASAGVQYSTLFTLPFIILANYHSSNYFEEESRPGVPKQIRGLGTDVSLVQSMVFVAQFFLSVCMGSVVYAVGSTTAVVVSACILSFLGSIAASQVMYNGL